LPARMPPANPKKRTGKLTKIASRTFPVMRNLRGIIRAGGRGLANSQISHGTRVEAAIRAACRRRLVVLAVEQLALALAVVLSGGVLMLLLGTEILHWYWLLAFALPGVALACVRMRGRTLPPYRVAQIVDKRLHLSDSLSTAWFLLSTVKAHDDPVARFQIQRAEDLARSVKPARAFPFKGQRAWALTAALGAVVFGLFALRYLVTHTLNPERALLPIHLGAIFDQLERSLFPENRQPTAATLNPQGAGSHATGGHNQDGSGQIFDAQDFEGKQDGIDAGQAQPQSSDSQP